jgi:hypothetical protein
VFLLKHGARAVDTDGVIDSGRATVVIRRPRLEFLRRRGGTVLGSLKRDPSMHLALRAALGSRLIVWVVGLAVITIFGANIGEIDPRLLAQPFHSIPLDNLVAPAARWDSAWYIAIAQHGYFSPQSSAFFPLYPLLMAFTAPLFGSPFIAGLVISLASMVLGFMALYRLALLDLDAPAARLTVVLLALFPTSLFLSAVYTESLFLALSVSAVYAARTERWMWAGVLGCLAGATRSDGILIAVPLVLLYAYGPRREVERSGFERWWQPRYRGWRSALWLGLVPIGAIAYLAYLGILHGDPLAPFKAESDYWGRSFAGPLWAIVKAVAAVPGDIHRIASGTTAPVATGDPISWTTQNLIDSGFVPLAIFGLISAWRRLPLAYVVYALVLLIAATSSPYPYAPLASFSRYLLVIFPLFMGVAARLSGRRKLTVGVLSASTVLLVAFSGLWANWAWVA